eukprot:7033240-Alexandrium_andersonii.AAC.1
MAVNDVAVDGHVEVGDLRPLVQQGLPELEGMQERLPNSCAPAPRPAPRSPRWKFRARRQRRNAAARGGRGHDD